MGQKTSHFREIVENCYYPGEWSFSSVHICLLHRHLKARQPVSCTTKLGSGVFKRNKIRIHITRGTGKGPGNGVHKTKGLHVCRLVLLHLAQTELTSMSGHFPRGCWGDFEIHLPSLPQRSGTAWAPVLNPAFVTWGLLLHFSDQHRVTFCSPRGQWKLDLPLWRQDSPSEWPRGSSRPFSSRGTTTVSTKLPPPKMLYAICFHLLMNT